MNVRIGRLPWVGRLLQALGVNSVPAVGFFGQGWSIGTTLALYWVETVLVIVLVAVRIVLHRRLTRKAGHWNVPVETRTTVAGRTSVRHSRTTFLAGFLGIMVPFTAGHGLFLGMLILFVLPDFAGHSEDVSLADAEAGALAMAAFLGLGLLFDVIGLRDRPFRWVERITERAQGRMFVTHLTIIFGMLAMAVWEAPAALFAVFIGLKTLVDLGSLMPEREPAPEPPRWLRWLDGVGGSRAGLTFSQHYRQEIETARRTREANERVVDEGPAGLGSRADSGW
jgi:hypothetical protein